MTNWRAAIGRWAIAVAKTYFGDKTTFEMACDIEEHVAWLLPSKDMDEDEGMDVEEIEEEEPSIEEIVRRRKREFVSAPFLWGNGSIGTREKEPVCKCLPTDFLCAWLASCPSTLHSHTGIF